MSIDAGFRALTPEGIRKAARDLDPEPIRHWFTEIEGKQCPVKQLIRTAANLLRPPPPVKNLTTSEAVALLSHNGFTSRNKDWS